MVLLASVGLDDVRLLGPRSGVERLMNAFDAATLSSSSGEGFPNVLSEAMACGVPCIATDVGDAARIIGDTGIVVPPRSPEALADAWERMLTMGEAARQELGQRARARIVEHYSLDRMVEAYASLYRQVLEERDA